MVGRDSRSLRLFFHILCQPTKIGILKHLRGIAGVHTGRVRSSRENTLGRRGTFAARRVEVDAVGEEAGESAVGGAIEVRPPASEHGGSDWGGRRRKGRRREGVLHVEWNGWTGARVQGLKRWFVTPQQLAGGGCDGSTRKGRDSIATEGSGGVRRR